MVREAGISLDRALFPLLVASSGGADRGRRARQRVGRDYTTVSRQVAKLESLGLVERQAGDEDRRVRQAIVTPKGRAMTDAVDAARERIAGSMFATWAERDVEELVRLMRKFADAVTAPGNWPEIDRDRAACHRPNCFGS